MLKKKVFVCYYIFVLVIIITNIVLVVRDSMVFNMNDLPDGKLLYSIGSPNRDTDINVYKISNSIGSAIRVEELKRLNGDCVKRNVFWQTDIKDVTIEWEDNNVVVINDMPINIKEGGYYDCRRGISIITEGSIAPEVKR